MRFSNVFQLPLPQIRVAQQPLAVRVKDPVAAAASPGSLPPPDFSQLPEDLDQRVRLVGEWQLGTD